MGRLERGDGSSFRYILLVKYYVVELRALVCNTRVGVLSFDYVFWS